MPLGRKEHMVRDYAPLSARRLDVRLYAQWTQEDDWTVKPPARREGQERARVLEGVRPVRVVLRRRDGRCGRAPREDDA